MAKGSRASKGRGPTRRERREAELRARKQSATAAAPAPATRLSKRKQRAAANLAKQEARRNANDQTARGWRAAIERVARQRLLHAVALILVAIVTLMIGVGWWLAEHPPSWWAETDATSPRIEQTSRAVENWVVSTMTRAHPEDEQWAVTLTEEDANAWLAVRLPMWVASERGEWPEGIRSVRVRFHDGRVVLGADIRESGAEEPRVVAAAFRFRIGAEGDARVSVDWTQINRLKLPGAVGMNRISEWLDSAGEDEIAEQLAGLIRGEIETETIGWKLEDGRRVTVHALHIESGKVHLVCSTSPAGTSASR